VYPESHDAGELKPLVVPVLRELTDVVEAFKWLAGLGRL
jgi:hypothetical protein